MPRTIPNSTLETRKAQRLAHRRNRPLRSRRRGLATLEFAMSFPILFLLASLIFVSSKGMVLTNETTIEARTNSFKQALDHRSSGGPTRFVLEDVVSSNRYNADIIAGSASQKATVIKVLGSSTLTANASVSVLRNTWDHRELPLDDTSRLPLYTEILAGGSAGKLTSLVDQIRGLAGSMGSLVDGLTGLSQNTQKEPPGMDAEREKLAKAKEKEAQQKEKLNGEVKELKQDIKKIDEEKKQNNEDLDKAKQDEKDKKITADELKTKQEDTDKKNEALDKERAAKQKELDQKQGRLDFANKHS